MRTPTCLVAGSGEAFLMQFELSCEGSKLGRGEKRSAEGPWRDFAPQRHLAIFGDILDCYDWGVRWGWCYWHLLGGSQRFC